MILNGNLREYAMKVLIGVMTASVIAGGGFGFRINNRVTVMETRMETIQNDIREIKLDIKDLPRGEGGLSENERRSWRQMQSDIECIRAHLAGEGVCSP
jgi:hypothetical protein